MTRRRFFGMAVAAASASLAACGGPLAPAQAAPETPGRLVTLPDQRHINLRCSGHGGPTVVLEAGYGADSGAWYKVQPALAAVTQVCAYDRTGYGFSDAGPLPRDGAAIARDLDQALEAAGIEGPYVLVGHSAGGLYARLFAGRRPGEVKGMVLLDPTVEMHAPDPEHDGLDGIRRRVQRCLGAATAAPQPPQGDPQWEGCTPSSAGPHAWTVARRPDTWRNQLSELDAIFGRTSDEAARLGDVLRPVPLYVITASDTAAASAKLRYADQSLWELQHVRLAMGSDRGFQRTVLSSHLVMIDRPEVVIEAVKAMVGAIREGRAPDALPPSETATGAEPFTESAGVTK